MGIPENNKPDFSNKFQPYRIYIDENPEYEGDWKELPRIEVPMMFGAEAFLLAMRQVDGEGKRECGSVCVHNSPDPKLIAEMLASRPMGMLLSEYLRHSIEIRKMTMAMEMTQNMSGIPIGAIRIPVDEIGDLSELGDMIAEYMREAMEGDFPEGGME